MVVSENSCIRGKYLIGKGLRKVVQLVVRGECLTGDGSIAYDRSFAWVPQKSELKCCTAVHHLTVFFS